MRLIRWYLLALMMLLVPGTSAALQLRWSNGADTLSFATATQCVLILRADSTEALPIEWRLAWQADTAGVHFLAVDSVTACNADSAVVSALEPPATLADSLACLLTAHFCSEPGPAANVAYYILDQPGGSRGRLKVVALDPNDTSQNTVIESNEVTYNGGVEGDYAPVLLRAESTHETAELRVRVVGAWLDSVQTMKIGAPDDLWSVPLAISARNYSSVEGNAVVVASLPEAVVQAANSWNRSDVAWLAGDQNSLSNFIPLDIDTVLFCDPEVTSGWYPKDFAFRYETEYDPTDIARPWKGYFHLFYIRAKRNAQGQPIADSDSALAHAWSADLRNWQVELHAFGPRRQSTWENGSVWAPNIHHVGNLFHMFYTGVDSVGNQSIGHATAPSLWTPAEFWTRFDLPMYTVFDTEWAERDGIDNFGKTSFRDPFVMPDPDNPGYYLLFNTGEDENLSPRYTIGVARNVPGTFGEWDDLGNYEATDVNHLSVTGALESPMVVRDSLTGAWRMFIANAAYDDDGYFSTAFLTQNVGDSLTDRSALSWPQSDWLYDYLDDDNEVIGWQACEHLQIGPVHFFAAFNGDGIGITRMHWDPELEQFIIGYPSLTSVAEGRRPDGVTFSLTGLRPGAGSVRFAIESTGQISPRLTVYDIMGRRVRLLTDGRAIEGRSEIEWDDRGESGQRVASGIYFARLTGAGSAQVLRVPMVR